MSDGKAVRGIDRHMGDRASRRELADGSRKRVRVAIATLLVTACALALLAFQGNAERSPKTVGVAQYLLFGDRAHPDDPLSLTAAVSGFELTGVALDGSVIGYSSNDSVRQTCSKLSLALQSDGWVLESDDGQGLLNFTRLSGAEWRLAGASEKGSQQSGLFVQCVPTGCGSAVVVSRW